MCLSVTLLCRSELVIDKSQSISSGQSTEAALDFTFNHCCCNISIRWQRESWHFAVNEMKMTKTAISCSGSEARGHAQVQSPGQGPLSPLPKAGCASIASPTPCWRITQLQKRRVILKLHWNRCMITVKDIHFYACSQALIQDCRCSVVVLVSLSWPWDDLEMYQYLASGLILIKIGTVLVSSRSQVLTSHAHPLCRCACNCTVVTHWRQLSACCSTLYVQDATLCLKNMGHAHCVA